jgi:hypothetical protein
MESKPLFSEARVINKIPINPAILPEDPDLAVWPIDGLPMKLRGDADDQLIRSAVNCAGWHTVQCVVLLEGGTNITIQPLEVIRYRPDGGDRVNFLIPLGATTGALVHMAKFDLTPRGGLVHFRLHAVTGNVTKATIMISGVERDLEALRVG